MLDRGLIAGRLDMLDCKLIGFDDDDEFGGGWHPDTSNPENFGAWLLVVASIIGADWRDLDADWWRAEHQRFRSPSQAVEAWLEATA